MQYDEAEIRKCLAVMKPNNKLFEIRIIGNDKSNYSGYFRDVDTLLEQLKRVRVDGNVYITLNCINDACYDREQKDHFIRNAKATTSDNDIIGYEWIMVDLDPKRPSGTSSTDDQIQKAKNVGNRIYGYMRQIGFEEPVMALSGNGVHLLYRVAIGNDSERKKLIETALKTLSMLFSTDEIEVDRKNFNPARICKLYGTMAMKGTNTEERPHRMSGIINADIEVKATDIVFVKKLCDKYPKEAERPQRYNNFSPREFNLEDWLNKYQLNYKKDSYDDGTKFILECCPFDSNHKGKDACIFQSRTGAIGFHCFHNSCSDKKWQDVRMLFEPDAYEKRWQQQDREMYHSYNREKPKVELIKQQDGIPVFFNAMDIYQLPKDDETFIKTGIQEWDKCTRGLKKGNVSMMTGSRAAGKSSVLSQLMLEAVDGGNNVGCFSGELTEKNFMKWMNLQAAGKARVKPTKFDNYYEVPDNIRKDIANWLGDHFWLYNNAYGNKFEAVLKEFEKAITEHSLDLLVLDNLMAFNILTMSDIKWEAQTKFVLKLTAMAKKYNVHILFVAHPRKTLGFLRLEDISGSADLANAVDDAFIVHRVNQDFKNRSREMFGWKEDNDLYNATNVIEIAKNRDGGTQDKFIPLYYDPVTKRLRNSVSESRVYGWDVKMDSFTDIDDGDELPWEFGNE